MKNYPGAYNLSRGFMKTLSGSYENYPGALNNYPGAMKLLRVLIIIIRSLLFRSNKPHCYW